MPIRFRCPSCDGLLSIATRKAGTEVACPKCREGLIVPSPAEATAPPPGPFSLFGPEPAGGTMLKAKPEPKVKEYAEGDEPLFERSDFEKLFEPAVRSATGATREVPAPPPGLVHVAAKPTADYGITLSRPAAMALAAGFVVMLGVSFTAGFLVGR